MIELGVALAVAHLSVKRIQRSESRAPSSCDESTFWVARLVVSRPRASFDAGLLLPRSVSQVSLRTPCGARFESCAFTFFRTLRCNRRSPDDCASSLRSQNFEDGHVPCSLFSAHVVLAFPVLAFTKTSCDVSMLASAFGSFRRPLPRFRAKRPSVFTVRVHDQELLAVLTSFVSTVLAFRRSRATRIGSQSTGCANSCHVSTSVGADLLLFEDLAFSSHPAISPILAFRP